MKTALDHWILRTFVFRYCVFCNTVPPALPLDIEVEESSSGRWSYRLFCGDEAAFRAVTTLLSSCSFAFKSDIVVRETATARILAKSVKESLVMRAVWWIIFAMISGGLAILFGKFHVLGSCLKRLRSALGMFQSITAAT